MMSKLFLVLIYSLLLNNNTYAQNNSLNKDSINYNTLRNVKNPNSMVPLKYYNYKPYTGKAYEWLPSGILKSEITYKDGDILYSKYFYENGKIKSEGHGDLLSIKFSQTQLIEKEYYENGNLKMEVLYKVKIEQGYSSPYKTKGDVIHSKEYFENGKIKTSETAISNGFQYTSYFEDGKVSEIGKIGNNPFLESTYSNGLPYGYWKSFYANGNLEYEGAYAFARNDNEVNLYKQPYHSPKSGIWKYFYENGALRSSGQYLFGNENGNWNEYYDNKILKSTGSYTAGVKTGLWKDYYSNGKLKSVGSYSAINDNMGDPIGTWKHFNDDGTLNKINRYASKRYGYGLSQFNGAQEYYFKNGKLKSTENFWQGKQEGVFRTYFESGIIESETNYIDGKMEGNYLVNFPSGSRSEIGMKLSGPYCYCPIDSCVTLKYFESGNIKLRIVTKNKSYGAYAYGSHEYTFFYDKQESPIAGKAFTQSCNDDFYNIVLYENNGKEKYISYIPPSPQRPSYRPDFADYSALMTYVENFIKGQN